MKGNMEERAERLALYILENRATVRAAAQKFGISKSSVHKDLAERLPTFNRTLYLQVKEVLEFGFGDRGMKNYQTVRESKYAEETVLVPSKYMDKPKFTIGLGDSFVGGVQMCF